MCGGGLTSSLLSLSVSGEEQWEQGIPSLNGVPDDLSSYKDRKGIPGKGILRGMRAAPGNKRELEGLLGWWMSAQFPHQIPVDPAER